MRKIIIHSSRGEFRALLRSIIADIATDIREAHTREALFEQCRYTHFDIVFTDDERMFMNGSQAIKEIRPATTHPHIFIFSRNMCEDTVVALLEMGINQFITLPFSPRRVIGKIEKAL